MLNPYIIYPIISAFLTAIIGILQKKGIQGEKFSLRRLLKSKRWWFGYFLGLPIAYFSALALNNLDVSIIVPVSNLSIPLLIIFSNISLGEKINKHEAIGIILLIISTIMLGVA
ncbi:MAG: hypothetical protein PHW96_03245 [Candidatus Nanoarchaeia archaeon]|nr:hypothetical protein [Candidatus Nanoarchaeia archaeon]